ncbi:unnamed protein product [Nesidiocoris tenuis]|uniref:Small integral membrane protein 15 n=1 Tax=Nesidiocoris tenuis TaxID=355587 RepID=A0A6H5GC97_9HEMI|nr:unnamed protein product [Nesidiocoris tenuis]
MVNAMVQAIHSILMTWNPSQKRRSAPTGTRTLHPTVSIHRAEQLCTHWYPYHDTGLKKACQNAKATSCLDRRTRAQALNHGHLIQSTYRNIPETIRVRLSCGPGECSPIKTSCVRTRRRGVRVARRSPRRRGSRARGPWGEDSSESGAVWPSAGHAFRDHFPPERLEPSFTAGSCGALVLLHEQGALQGSSQYIIYERKGPWIPHMVVKRSVGSLNLVPSGIETSRTPIHIETAVFVDKDLYRHMSTNFVKDTDQQLITFVLTLVNAVSETAYSGAMEPPATPTASPAVGLNLDKNTWEGWINSFIVWAAQDPSGFLTTILLILSPFLAISLLLAWRLSRILKVQKKENSKKIRKETNTSRLRLSDDSLVDRFVATRDVAPRKLRAIFTTLPRHRSRLMRQHFLCTCEKIEKTRIQSFASEICSRAREVDNHLSGTGFQKMSSDHDEDRACRIACQDETVPNRFYLVNGEEGWFPFGTDCGKNNPSRLAYCVSGKCLIKREELMLITPSISATQSMLMTLNSPIEMKLTLFNYTTPTALLLRSKSQLNNVVVHNRSLEIGWDMFYVLKRIMDLDGRDLANQKFFFRILTLIAQLNYVIGTKSKSRYSLTRSVENFQTLMTNSIFVLRTVGHEVLLQSNPVGSPTRPGLKKATDLAMVSSNSE